MLSIQTERLYTLEDLEIIRFPSFSDQKAALMIFEGGKQVPFMMSRVFTVHAQEKVTRGHHAHKACAQLLVVLQGECRVRCDDGLTKKEILLNNPREGLLIPPTLWAEQDYEPNTVLMVLTDQPYDENDYVRQYSDFLAFRREK